MTQLIDIAPSILAADWTRLGEEVESVRRGGASLVHVDVMDGHFVPNITIGLPAVSALRDATPLPLDVHLMISEPGRYAEEFVRAGAAMVTVHVEADAHLNRTLVGIRSAGALAGVAINPATSLSAIEESLPFADHVLVMSVNPGFGGQSFIPMTLDKVRRLREMIRVSGYRVRIEIDGGIDESNIAAAIGAGADIIVAGSAVFNKKDDPAERVRSLRERATPLI